MEVKREKDIYTQTGQTESEGGEGGRKLDNRREKQLSPVKSTSCRERKEIRKKERKKEARLHHGFIGCFVNAGAIGKVPTW